MMTQSFARLVAWCAFAAAAVTVITIVSITLYFALIPTLGAGNVFGPINDVFSIFFALLGIPVLLALARLHRHLSPGLNAALVAAGVTGAAALAIAQTMFVFGAVDLAFTMAVAPLTGLTALAMGVLNLQALRAGTLPRLMAWLGLIAAAGSALGAIALALAGMESPLTWVGILSYLINPVWFVWFGRLLLTERLPATSGITPIGA